MTLLGFIIVLILTVLVVRDSKKRGMCSILWGLGTFLVPFITVPLYLLFR